jgi:hypothetical protein
LWENGSHSEMRILGCDINSNHFDPNSNLNYEHLLHVKQYMGALHHTIKYMHQHEMQQIFIYLNK